MTELAPDFRHPRRYVRLDTILRLRWLAVLGQLATIFIVSEGLDFEVPVIPCVVIIGLSSLLNLVLQIRFNPVHRLGPREWAARGNQNKTPHCPPGVFCGGLDKKC